MVHIDQADGTDDDANRHLHLYTFEDDTWFLYTPSCTAEVTFSTCNASEFDTRLAVYDGAGCVTANSTQWPGRRRRGRSISTTVLAWLTRRWDGP